MPERYCERPGCGRPIPSRKRQDTRWCSRSCESKAHRLATKRAEFAAAHPEEMSSYQAHVRGGSESREDLSPAPEERAEWAERDAQLNKLLGVETQQREERRTRTGSWFSLKKLLSRNPGVEPPAITEARVERARAEQRATVQRLQSAPGRVQNRFDASTSGNVAQRGAESRKRNKVYATADPRPASQRDQYDFSNQTVDGGPFGRGRLSGQRPGHADYRWQMTDGWTY